MASSFWEDPLVSLDIILINSAGSSRCIDVLGMTSHTLKNLPLKGPMHLMTVWRGEIPSCPADFWISIFIFIDSWLWLGFLQVEFGVLVFGTCISGCLCDA